MSASFLSRLSDRGDHILAVDLSTPITKAVHVRRQGDRFALVNYCLEKSPCEQTAPSQEALAEHLKGLRQALGAKTRKAVLVVGMEDSVLRNVESPAAERTEMRRMLQLNSKHFFQQEMTDFVFDCFIPNGVSGGPTATTKASRQNNVLVGALKREMLGGLHDAAERAGFVPVEITLSQIGLANAAVLAADKTIHKDVLALLHVGAQTSAISFLTHGTLAFTRVIGIGSHQMSSRLAEAFKNSDSIPEEFKPSVLQSNIENSLAPLARDVRAAIDYLENEQGVQVLAGYASGDLVRSNLVVETLQVLQIPCLRLDLRGFLHIEVPPENKPALEQDLAQLELAVGAAVGWLKPERIEINLLAEQIEAAALRRRDPVRWAIGVGAVMVLLLLLWTGWNALQSARAGTRLQQVQTELKSVEKALNDVQGVFKQAAEVERVVIPLHQHATNRFLWALPLNALQQAVVDDIQVVGLKMEQTLIQVDAIKTANKAPAQTREQILLTITARNFADHQAEDKFIERIAALPYFKSSLRKKDPVMLKQRFPRQVDSLDTTKTFTLFTIECVYPERVLGHE